MVRLSGSRSREMLCVGPWCKTQHGANQEDYEEGGGKNDTNLWIYYTSEMMKIGQVLWWVGNRMILILGLSEDMEALDVGGRHLDS